VADTFLTPLLNDPGTRWALRNVRSGLALATRVEGAFDSTTRNRGLLGRTSLSDGDGLILAPCNSIHTFFMQFAIDVAFVRRDGHVVKIRKAVRPWRLSAAVRAFAVVELPTGVLDRTDTLVDDQLQLTPG
jgi:uncharacterized membrane protein (UPF0127 family)